MLAQNDTLYEAGKSGSKNVVEVNAEQLVDFSYDKYMDKLQTLKESTSVRAPSKTQKSKNMLNAMAYQLKTEQMIIDPDNVMKDSWKKTKGKYGW